MWNINITWNFGQWMVFISNIIWCRSYLETNMMRLNISSIFALFWHFRFDKLRCASFNLFQMSKVALASHIDIHIPFSMTINKILPISGEDHEILKASNGCVMSLHFCIWFQQNFNLVRILHCLSSTHESMELVILYCHNVPTKTTIKRA